jgi:NitT/TauT family transport system ATP-binding protein
MTIINKNKPILSLRNLCLEKTTGNQTKLILSNISLDVYQGDVVAILGRTGSGKTELMRILAGLSNPTRGEIIIDPDSSTNMVFQKPILLPWLTVWQNIQIGLASKSLTQQEKDERTWEIVNRVGLEGFEHHYTVDLSSGMKQRTAIARALVTRPNILLMDEPFSAIDTLTVESLWQDLLSTWYTGTLIFITNSAEEAVYYAKRIVLFSGSDITKQPSYISCIINCDIPFPRHHASEEFQYLIDRVYYMISSNLHVPALGNISPPTLPDIEIDELLGLLISMDSYQSKGSIELQDLSEYMDIEIDPIMEVIYCLSLLRFVEVNDGACIITDLGQNILHVDINSRKAIFADAMVKNIPFTSILLNNLNEKEFVSYKEAIFILESILHEQDAEEFISTFLNWAIYSDLIIYDVNKKVIRKYV